MVTAAAAGTAACSRARVRSAPVRSVRTRSGAAGGRRRCAHACEGPSGGEVEGRGRSNGGDEREGGGKPGPESEPFTRRFLEPRIDDRGLPIADALVSGWMVPSTLAIGTIALRLPLPMWLTPALGVPALKSLSYLPSIVSHGAQLAICWTAGALACKAFERENYANDAALSTTLRSGAVASGLLILATQLKLTAILGVYPVLLTADLEPGSAEDLLLGNTQGELVVDLLAEAGAMTLWRTYRGGLP